MKNNQQINIITERIKSSEHLKQAVIDFNYSAEYLSGLIADHVDEATANAVKLNFEVQK